MNFLLHSFKESLAFFSPAQGKMMVLVISKGLLSTYRNIFVYFWWLLFASVMADNVYTWFLKKYPKSYSVILLVPLAIWTIVALAVYVSARPSIMRKSYQYYMQYSIFFFPLFLFIIVSNIAVENFFRVIAYYGLSYGALIPVLGFVPSFYIPFFLSPLCILFVFFMLDGPVSIAGFFNAFWYAIKMLLYNYPFFFILFLIGVSIYRVIMMAQPYFGNYAELVAQLILLPLMACIIVTFYTKRLADQFGLYYSDQGKEQIC